MIRNMAELSLIKTSPSIKMINSVLLSSLDKAFGRQLACDIHPEDLRNQKRGHRAVSRIMFQTLLEQWSLLYHKRRVNPGGDGTVTHASMTSFLPWKLSRRFNWPSPSQGVRFSVYNFLVINIQQICGEVRFGQLHFHIQTNMGAKLLTAFNLNFKQRRFLAAGEFRILPLEGKRGLAANISAVVFGIV